MPNDDKLRQFGAHQKALELFDLVVTDMRELARDSMLQRLISQQYASADSIASNIEEGYGRSSACGLRAILDDCARLRARDRWPLRSIQTLAPSRCHH